MEAFPASVVPSVRALMVSARSASRSRRRTLEQLTAAAQTSRVAQPEATSGRLVHRLLRLVPLSQLALRRSLHPPRAPAGKRVWCDESALEVKTLLIRRYFNRGLA